MKKKIYKKPEIQVVILQHQVPLLVSSGGSGGSGEEPTDAPLWNDEIE